MREMEQGLRQRCPYCREPLPKTDEEIDRNNMQRAKANDPMALFKIGEKCYRQGDIEGTLQYWTKAAELGDMCAHYNLSCSYREGEGVEKDLKKQLHHLEEAAIGGHPDARFNLGCVESENGRHDIAAKHFVIAARLGFDVALEQVKKYFRSGFLSKEDYEAALLGHQTAVDATKSTQRDEAYQSFQHFQN